MKALYIFSLAAAVQGWAAAPEVIQAQELYQRTEYSTSLELLLRSSSRNAAATQLIGQNYFMQGEFRKASEFLEQAAKLNPESAETSLWAGRAFGRRAETASPFTAPGFAAKARQYFEKAVALDPSNREALGDLFDYYVGAPGFLGGGEKKAEALAARVSERDPAEGHYYQAQLADRHKEYDNAERHLRSALEIAPRQAGRFLDLARFLAKRGRTGESEALFDEAAKISPTPKVQFERARTYIGNGRNLSQARRLLEQYLKGPLTANDPSREEAQALLKKIGE